MANNTSPRFMEMVHKRYLPPSTDFHGPFSLSEQIRLVEYEGDNKFMLEEAADEGNGEFKTLLAVNELERTGVGGKLQETQDTFCAKRKQVVESVVDFIGSALVLVAVHKNQAAFIQAIDRMGEYICKFWNDLANESHIVVASNSGGRAMETQIA